MFPSPSFTPHYYCHNIFFLSGKSDFQNPGERGTSIGMASVPTQILGLTALIAAVSIAAAIYLSIGAVLITLVL